MATRKEKELLRQIKNLNTLLEKEIGTRRNAEVKKYKNQSLIIVSNRLPISLKKDPSTNKWSTSIASGGLVSALSCIKFKMKWIGYVGMDVDDSEKPEINKILEEINCIPVYIPQELYSKYYNGFSNDVLWPILHYVQLPMETLTNEREYWSAYKAVNKLMCDVIVDHLQAQDVVWIHDYHLMVLPKYLRQARPLCKIGWFLHTPFPNCDIYRTLSYRADLLKSVLACDLVGFHIYDYAKNFKSACAVILGCDSSVDAIEYNNKMTLVDAFPIGIDVNKFEMCKQKTLFKQKIRELRKRFGNGKIIIGVDRLDYIKGIMHKLVALEKFFCDNEDWINKVTYVQISVPTRPNVREYQKLAENVHEMVGRINGKYSNLTHVPIHYLDTSVDLETLVALYCIADVCLITSLRDGMNLVSYEYIASQMDEYGLGVLIMSEFAGAAQSLGAGSIQINPWNIEEVSVALKRALTMSDEEKHKLFSYSKQYVVDHSSQDWAEDFMFTLNQSWEITNSVYEDTVLPKKIKIDNLKEAYQSSRNRIIIFGVVGTLVDSGPFNKTDCEFEKIQMSNQAFENLKALASDEKNNVIVVSSRKRSLVEKIFKDIPLIICAENGYYLRDNAVDFEWIKTAETTDLTWMDAVEKIATYFVERTPNTFMERLETGIVWHYYNCSDAFAEKQARDLISNLQTGPLFNSPTEVVHDRQNKLVKVRLIAFNKTLAISRAMDYLSIKNGLSDEDSKFINASVSLENGRECGERDENGDAGKCDKEYKKSLSAGNLKKMDPEDSKVRKFVSYEESLAKNKQSPLQDKETTAPIEPKSIEDLRVSQIRLESHRQYDFVLCIGNYFEHDQKIFRVLNERYGAVSEKSPFKIEESEGSWTDDAKDKKEENPNVFTISVGKRKSLAKSYVENMAEVEKLMETLVCCSKE